MQILYLKTNEWEIDFITNELFPTNSYFEFYDTFSTLMREELVSNCALVVNHTLDFNEAVDLVKYLKPLVIVHLSDEEGRSRWIELAKHTKLYLHQYNHSSVQYPSNSLQIPLGYVTGFLREKKHIKTSSQRKYTFAFVGQLKQDRAEMLKESLEVSDNNAFYISDTIWQIDKLKLSPSDVFDIYNDSKYVLAGRGFISLDCFRIYEAIVAGSIPVVVGTESEILSTFGYTTIPPIIYADDWKQALAKCNLNDSARDRRIILLREWWLSEINTIRKAIAEVDAPDR